MGKLGLAVRCFFRVFRDADFVKMVESPPKSLSAPESKITPEKDSLPLPENALHLLALLQEEGRLIDFLQEDITSFEDEQIGAAVRAIHSGCQRTLKKLFEIVPVASGNEGDPFTVPEGFDPTEIKLVGDIRGKPPFSGEIKHHGWKVTKTNFPPKTENASILAQAEIELS